MKYRERQKYWIFSILRWNPSYFLIFVGIFVVEVCIAMFISDGFIRPFLGDALVVILMYSFLRAFLRMDYRIIAVICLFFAYFIEIMQAFRFGERLGLSGIGMIILGSRFDPLDIVAYSIGFLVCISLDWRRYKQEKSEMKLASSRKFI